MSWKEYDTYCEWLFSLLNKVETSINISNYNSYQSRIFGFMAERLLNIYVEANRLDVKEYPVLFISNENSEDPSYIMHTIKNQYNKVISKLLNLKRA